MNKKDCLDLIMLLSALESWAYAEGKRMPDYLSNDVIEALEKLCKEVLGNNETLTDSPPSKTRKGVEESYHS